MQTIELDEFMTNLISIYLSRITVLWIILFATKVYSETIPCNKLTLLEVTELSQRFSKLEDTSGNDMIDLNVASRLLCGIESLAPQEQESFADFQLPTSLTAPSK